MVTLLKKNDAPKRVIHVFRAPVGGLFRHVYDLIRGQKNYDLKLGLICDSNTGDDHSKKLLKELEASCELGVFRIPMGRTISWSDVKAVSSLNRICAELKPDIIHGHGAKGGAYVRLISKFVTTRIIYTTHGGSLHYSIMSPVGFVYLMLERMLKHRTDGLIFESLYSNNTYVRKLGNISNLHQVIHNGLHENEFTSIVPNNKAKDFVFIGELRKLKGIDVLLKATAKLNSQNNLNLLIAGAGPDIDSYKRQIKDLGLENNVTLSPAIYPATTAFALGRCVIVPSLAESFPYIVLEAAAAKVPLVATNVGGIPEIFGPYSDQLITPGDSDALAQAMKKVLDNPQHINKNAESLQHFVKQNYSVDKMVDNIIKFYRRVYLS
ncbi:MAG: glycosyltransferase family 4 protein [Thiohalomonadales bacterium]